MDITALYDREVDYYSGRPIVAVIPTIPVTEVEAAVTVAKTDTGVKTTITAPFSPLATITVASLKIVNKVLGVPISYSGFFTTADTATLTPAPQLTVGQEVTIGTDTYSVSSVTGSVVTFERAVSDLLVFAAAIITDDVTYQWQIEGSTGWENIPGATSRVYEPITADVGKDLRVIITYTDGRGGVGESTVVPPSSILPNQTRTITPNFPTIAEIELDVTRSYAANTLNTFIVEIDNT